MIKTRNKQIKHKCLFYLLWTICKNFGYSKSIIQPKSNFLQNKPLFQNLLLLRLRTFAVPQCTLLWSSAQSQCWWHLWAFPIYPYILRELALCHECHCSKCWIYTQLAQDICLIKHKLYTFYPITWSHILISLKLTIKYRKNTHIYNSWYPPFCTSEIP